MQITKKIGAILLLCASLISVYTLPAYAGGKSLHGMITTRSQAKQMAVQSYIDGTNVLVVNNSSHYVDVDVPDLGETINLPPHQSYYIYSDIYYDSIWLDIYDDCTGDLIASGYTDNPSTVTIDDVWYNSLMKAANKAQKSLKVTYSKSI